MTYIIAEIGVNHNNNLDYSKKLLIFVHQKKFKLLNFKLIKLVN